MARVPGTGPEGLLDEILIDPLEENLADDPYGTAIYAIRNVIHRACKRDGQMNDTELKTLLAIEELVRQRDNAA